MAAVARSGVELACELAELGADLLEARLRRQVPELDDREIERQIAAWWLARPGAPDGDSPGVLRPIPLAWQ